MVRKNNQRDRLVSSSTGEGLDNFHAGAAVGLVVLPLKWIVRIIFRKTLLLGKQ